MARRSLVTLAGALVLGVLISLISAGPAHAAAGTATITASRSGTNVWKNDVVNLVVDFPTAKFSEGTYGGYPRLSVFASDDNDTFTKVATGAKSDKWGKLTLSYKVGESTSWAKVCNDKDRKNGQKGTLFNDGTTELCTAVVEFDPQEPPEAGVDLKVAANARTATARFAAVAAKKGRAASLQIATIVTDMTGAVATSTWKTVASANQNATGEATFTVPNPYEVAHAYRAVSGGFTSAEVSLDQGALSESFGKRNTGIPQLYFNTNEQAKVSNKTTWVEGRFTIKQAGSNVQFAACDDPVKDKDGGSVDTSGTPLLAALKGRGNYSWSFAKKSFSLKLDKRSDLCGMGANKKWALVANHYDKSLLRNSVAGFIGTKLTNLDWTAESVPVDFWMNGAYQGSYLLIERITPDSKTPRIPYDALDDNRYYNKEKKKDPGVELNPEDTPGFILEWDFRRSSDVNVKVNTRGYVSIIDPEYDYNKKTGEKEPTGITASQVNYISDYLKDCDTKLYGATFKDPDEGWRSCIDEASAVDYYIGQELMKSVDSNMWASIYMWKPAGGKLRMGPLWDFDIAAGSANRAAGLVKPTGFYLRNVVKMGAKQSDKTWFNRLNEDPAFRAAVKARWTEIAPELKKSDAFLAAESKRIKASAAENFKKWSIKKKDSKVQVVKGSWASEVTYLRTWLKTRIVWLDANL